MTGHARQRSPGTWEIRWPLGTDLATGKRKIATATVRGGKKEAERELRRRLTEADNHIAAAAPAKMTVAEWLQRWLALTATEVRPNTAERYSAAVRLYLAPALGATRLRD